MLKVKKSGPGERGREKRRRSEEERNRRMREGKFDLPMQCGKPCWMLSYETEGSLVATHCRAVRECTRYSTGSAHITTATELCRAEGYDLSRAMRVSRRAARPGRDGERSASHQPIIIISSSFLSPSPPPPEMVTAGMRVGSLQGGGNYSPHAAS